ncbi:MAG: hypothetical protein JSR59_17810 [Proteobacteria bacterium]|nr:hypothetical protein [Pseudomonadota bacterium]
MRQLAGAILVAWLLAGASAAQAQTKPQPQPSTSPASRDNSQANQLPAGPDAGIPGTAQNAPLGTSALDSSQTSTVRRDARTRRRAPAASAPAAVNDSAAARLAARKPGAAKAAASAPAKP